MPDHPERADDRRKAAGDTRSDRSPPIDRVVVIRRLRIVLVCVAAGAVVLAAWGIFSRISDRKEVGRRTASDAILTVTVVRPQLSDAGDELVLPGTVQAFVEATIYARTSGYVKEWYTDIGTHVTRGQILALLETPEVDQQLQQARADLATANANLRLSRSTNERWQRLLATNSVSKQDAEDKAGDAAAKTAAAASAAANVKRLQELEGFKRVVAPFAGVVTLRNTDVGNLINAGEAANTQLFRIADTHKLRIYAQVPEAYADATKRGIKAELRFEEHPGRSYPAETVRTSNALDPSGRTLQVELELDNPNGEFFPGAYTEVHFKLPASVRSMRLPANTVLFRAAGLQVATLDLDHKIKLKTIKQGRDFGKTIEVLEGLEPRDNVIVNPPDSAFDGTPVRIAQKPPQPTGSGAGP